MAVRSRNATGMAVRSRHMASVFRKESSIKSFTANVRQCIWAAPLRSLHNGEYDHMNGSISSLYIDLDCEIV